MSSTTHAPNYPGILEGGCWDVEVQYAKASPNSLLMEVSVTNLSNEDDTIHVLPTLWYSRGSWRLAIED